MRPHVLRLLLQDVCCCKEVYAILAVADPLVSCVLAAF